MKMIIIYFVPAFLFLISCNDKNRTEKWNGSKADMAATTNFRAGYSEVNGLKMYYEIHGKGKPLVLLHGGGSTIQTSFGRILSALAQHREVIGVELQAHGHTNDRNTALSFEQDADDVAKLLRNLGIKKADFFGFSNGGNTTLQIAIRHPSIVNQIIVGSSFYKRSGVYPQFWDFMDHAKIEQMPKIYKDVYLEVSPHPENLQSMHDKCVRRMAEFKDWKDDELKSITAPTLLVIGDEDMVTPEHAVEMSRLIPRCKLAIIPGGHGEYMGEITTISSENEYRDIIVPIIEEFLDGSSGK